MDKIPVETLIKDLNLEVIVEAKNNKIDITTSDVNRPGLQFSGFYEHFAYERVQIIGKVETTFIEQLPDDVLAERADRFLIIPFPVLL